MPKCRAYIVIVACMFLQPHNIVLANHIGGSESAEVIVEGRLSLKQSELPDHTIHYYVVAEHQTVGIIVYRPRAIGLTNDIVFVRGERGESLAISLRDETLSAYPTSSFEGCEMVEVATLFDHLALVRKRKLWVHWVFLPGGTLSALILVAIALVFRRNHQKLRVVLRQILPRRETD
jgi:hypothetical protein